MKKELFFRNTRPEVSFERALSWKPREGVGIEEIVTALIALERVPRLSKNLKLSDETVSFEECLKRMLLDADGEARDALETALGNSPEDFRTEIEKKAEELELDGSDLSRAISLAIKNRDFRRIIGEGLDEDIPEFKRTEGDKKTEKPVPDYRDLIAFDPEARKEERAKLRRGFLEREEAAEAETKEKETGAGETGVKEPGSKETGAKGPGSQERPREDDMEAVAILGGLASLAIIGIGLRRLFKRT